MLRIIAFFLFQLFICESVLIPPKDNGALMARYIVHYSDYTSIATISSIPKIKGYPFVSIASISDGPETNGTGNPYMYLPSIDFTAMDCDKDTRISLMMSLIQGSYCVENKFDPEDPRCAHVMMSGRFVKVANNTEEYNFARKTLFQRHPIMASWPSGHHFFVAKINIEQIAVQDYFGGPLMVTPEEYFSVKASDINHYHYRLKASDFQYQIIGI